MTSRQRLNSKRSWAQESQARVAATSQHKRDVMMDMLKAARKQLNVSLPLSSVVPAITEAHDKNYLELESVSLEGVFEDVTLSLSRQRVAITGDNGAGKTSLLEVMLDLKSPDSGRVISPLKHYGYISQNATNWKIEESLFEYLWQRSSGKSYEEVISGVIAHKFPLGLADKPMRELSSGERLRAALICLFTCRNFDDAPMDYLVLDEPTVSLDLLGLSSLKEVLNLWSGGLIVVSHDKGFLNDINLESFIKLS